MCGGFHKPLIHENCGQHFYPAVFSVHLERHELVFVHVLGLLRPRSCTLISHMGRVFLNLAITEGWIVQRSRRCTIHLSVEARNPPAICRVCTVS